ncbi:MAG: hypothetical protein BWY59_00180 [Verrucomicrobia bacterium ADurb.Bin345]|nr:MAG: hypothetical protein BWY59_00180 [Verrucomicrobia bacterium ADurb.Bin345]
MRWTRGPTPLPRGFAPHTCWPTSTPFTYSLSTCAPDSYVAARCVHVAPSAVIAEEPVTLYAPKPAIGRSAASTERK